MRTTVSEELRSLLRDELSAERPPPLGDLVATALRDGRRIRRNRRFAAAGTTTVAGFVVLAMALGSPFAAAPAPGAGHQVAARPDPVRSSAAPAPTRSRPAPVLATPIPGGLRPATPEAMLALLTKLVPAGVTTHYAKASDGSLHVQMYLDRGKGPGMIRVSLGGAPDAESKYGEPKVTIAAPPGNCVQSRIVRAEQPGGLTVQADLGTCLAWDGKENPKAALILTDAEARAVVTDPRWGLDMDQSLVKTGTTAFPKLARFG